MSPGATVAIQASAVEVVEEVVPGASAVAVPAPVPGKGAEVAEEVLPVKGDQFPGAVAAEVVPGAPPPAVALGEV